MVAAVAVLRKVRIPDTTWSFVVPHIIAPNRLSVRAWGSGDIKDDAWVSTRIMIPKMRKAGRRKL